jgi:hypothetical protein
MKSKLLVSAGILCLLALVTVISHDAYAWVGGDNQIYVRTIAGSKTTPDGLYLTLQVYTTNTAQVQNVKSLRAWNTNPGIDPTIYTSWNILTEDRKANTIYYGYCDIPYTGQYGAYNIEVTYQDDTTETLVTLPVNQQTDPFPSVGNIEVDFSTGPATPTFRFMPLSDPNIDFYQLRVRYYDQYDQPAHARLIYRTVNITTWTPGQPIEVTFLQSGDGIGTEEPLVPGVEYVVRVDAIDQDGASSPSNSRAQFLSHQADYFRVPYSSIVYDDFSGPYIDRKKWRQGESVREIVGGKLVLKTASSNPISIGSYPVRFGTDMVFPDPASITSISADVAITESAIVNNGYPRAYIGGRWFNDGAGAPGTDMTGDIWAEVNLTGTPTGPVARWSVSRYTNASGSTYTVLGGANFTTPITPGTSYPLSISYNSGTNLLTFMVGTELKTFGHSDGLPDWSRNTNVPWNALTTRVQVNDANSSGYIASTFDNVRINGDPDLYDDFSSPTINPAKWTNYEFVREITGGQLRSKSRSSTVSTVSFSNSLEFPNPNLIKNLQAKVTPVAYQNSEGAEAKARLSGIFYNDGTPGGTGYIGDVQPEIRIGLTGTTPTASWIVWRFTNSAGTTATTLDSGSFTTPITLGDPYTLFLGWDGNRFTFKINGEGAHYTPTTCIFPPNTPWKTIGTRISNNVAKEATIEALFDDVMVTVVSPLYLYVSTDGLCECYNPCFPIIQNGISSASAASIIKITQETYNEAVILDVDGEITLQGGWDASFATSSSYTNIDGSLTIKHGTMIIEKIILQ